jgi:hypothetical protein
MFIQMFWEFIILICHINVIFINNNNIEINYINKENNMKIRRQISANARKKQLKVQHHKMNSRRQFYFNQVVSQEESTQKKEH